VVRHSTILQNDDRHELHEADIDGRKQRRISNTMTTKMVVMSCQTRVLCQEQTAPTDQKLDKKKRETKRQNRRKKARRAKPRQAEKTEKEMQSLLQWRISSARRLTEFESRSCSMTQKNPTTPNVGRSATARDEREKNNGFWRPSGVF
jgi:hypothetical protein